jgi:hypothetical protein
MEEKSTCISSRNETGDSDMAAETNYSLSLLKQI